MDDYVTLTVPTRLAADVAFLLRVGRNEVSVSDEAEALVDEWCDAAAPTAHGTEQ